MRPHPLEIAQAQRQGAHDLGLACVFRAGRQGRLGPRQLGVQFGHHPGQDCIVHLILHHAADRRRRLEHGRNK